MAKRKNTEETSESSAASGATVGYEAKLWQMADALRGTMDAADYKHVVLSLIFLKYISDAFEEQHAKLVAEQAKGADPEDPDEYRALSIFWVPPEARWQHLKAQARQATIGRLVDDAMAGIERDNPALNGVLPKDYARPALDKTRLGQIIDLISNIKVGDQASRAKDVLGRMADRTHRELTDEDISRIAGTYHAWRGEKESGEYKDVPGFCKSAPLDEVRKHGHVLTPGRYVGAEAQVEDREPFGEKMKRLTATLREQQADAAKLDREIEKNLKSLGF